MYLSHAISRMNATWPIHMCLCTRGEDINFEIHRTSDIVMYLWQFPVKMLHLPRSTNSRNSNFSVQIQIKPKSQFEFVPQDNSEFKSNQNLNSTLYREIPKNLIFSILTSWQKSPHHSGFRLPFNSAFRVSSSTERAVVTRPVAGYPSSVLSQAFHQSNFAILAICPHALAGWVLWYGPETQLRFRVHPPPLTGSSTTVHSSLILQNAPPCYVCSPLSARQAASV